MNWTPRQQGIYRGLVTRAWAKQTTPESFHDRIAKDRWYRHTLHRQLGVWTTKQLGQDHFAACCSVFERIVGESFYWTGRSLGGTKAERERRVRWKIGEACLAGDLDEAYARGVARKACELESLPLLERLDLAQLLKTLDALREIVERNSPAPEPGDAERRRSAGKAWPA